MERISNSVCWVYTCGVVCAFCCLLLSVVMLFFYCSTINRTYNYNDTARNNTQTKRKNDLQTHQQTTKRTTTNEQTHPRKQPKKQTVTTKQTNGQVLKQTTGLGDFVFYSVLVGRAALYDMLTVVCCFIAVITVRFFNHAALAHERSHRLTSLTYLLPHPHTRAISLLFKTTE